MREKQDTFYGMQYGRGFPERRHTFGEVISSFMVIFPVSFLFALKNDLPHVLIISFCLLLLPLFLKKPLPATDRPVIYCITASMILTAVPDLLVSTDDARMGLFDILVRSSLVLPFLVYTAALGGLFASSGRICGGRLALAVAGMLLCGDRFNSRDVHNVYLSMLDPLLHHYFQVYMVCAVLQGIFLPFFVRTGSGERRNPHSGGEGKQWGKKEKGKKEKMIFFLLYGAGILLLILFVFFAAAFIRENASFLRSIEIYFMRLGSKGLRNWKNANRNMLSRKVDLRAPLPPCFGQLPDQVLFRAKASFAPGLLRSGVYVHYENGRWLPYKGPEEKKFPLDTVRRTGILSFSTFRLPSALPEGEKIADSEKDLPGEKQENKVELFLDNLVTFGLVPMPGNCIRIDAVADSAEISHNGILSLKHWKKDGGITFFVRFPDEEAAFNGITASGKEQGAGKEFSVEEYDALTRIPRWVKKYMQDTFPGNWQDLSGRRKLEMVKRFLAKNCSYSLYVPVPGKKEFFKDPVLRFLEDTRRGHCELFASAAVLLCRSMGLPARYVTGFVCEEKSPAGEYYFCRLAHAWGEVYVKEEKKWITLDAVSNAPSFLALYGRERSSYRKIMDLLQYKGQEFFALIRRGHFAEGILNIFTGIWELFKILFSTVYGWGLLVAAGGVWFWRIWHSAGKRKKEVSSSFLTEILGTDKRMTRKTVQKRFESFEKNFFRITGKKREKRTCPGMYYKVFSCPELEHWVEKYEILRFGSLEKTEFADIFLCWEKEREKILRTVAKWKEEKKDE